MLDNTGPVLILLVLLALIPAAIAKNKGRSFIAWWVYGVALWIVALIHSILLKPTAQVAERTAAANGLRRCPECMEWIQIGARKCRFCSAAFEDSISAGQAVVPSAGLPLASPTPKSRLAVVVVLVALGCALVLAATLSKSGSTNAAASDQGGSASSPANDSSVNSSPDYMPVRAVDLYQAYQRNEIAADGKYKGKLLLVSGYVNSINKDFLDDPYLSLATPNEFMSIQAHLKSSEVPKAANLAKGQAIEVLCSGNGMIVGSPMLADCVIENQ